MTQATEATITQRLRLYVREQIKGQEIYAYADIANGVIERFGNDPEFIERFLLDQIVRLVRLEVAAASRSTRTFQFSTLAMTDAAFRRAAIRRTLERWSEQTNRNHVRLVDMRRSELLAAASIRRDRGQRELRKAAFHQALAERLTTETQRVQDVWTIDELIDLAIKHVVDIDDVIADKN